MELDSPSMDEQSVILFDAIVTIPLHTVTGLISLLREKQVANRKAFGALTNRYLLLPI
jgi:hypothetical protein